MSQKLFLPGLLLVPALLVAVPSGADIPDPSPSLVPPVLTMTPDGSHPYAVQIVGTKGAPISGALVEIVFAPGTDELLAWCQGQVHPVVSAVTNSFGEATFFLAGGGCIDQVPSGTAFIAQVRADGIVVAELEAVNSPDITDGAGRRTLEWNFTLCDGGETTVGLADAVEHTAAIANGTVEVCSKFTAPYDDPVGLADAVLVTAYITAGTTCTCDP